MGINCKDCNRLIDECTCLEETVDFPKYTRDQKRRAVQECVKRLSEFHATLRLIRQFNIVEQDILEYTAALNNDPRYTTRYTISADPALTNSPAFDPYTGLSIGKWAVEARDNAAALARSLQVAENLCKDW